MTCTGVDTMEHSLAESDSESDNLDNMISGLCSQNRFSSLDKRVGLDSGNEWRNGQRNKRRRNNTGSVDLDTFSSMSNEGKLNALFSKIINIEENQSAGTNRLANIIGTAHAKVVKLEESSIKHNEQLKILTYKSIDLEARSRRNNLIFHGLADVINENSKDLILEFLENELDVDVSSIPIDRAHRMGHPVIVRHGPRVTRRPLIVAFRNYPDTDLILERASALRGTNFRIDRDLPMEIRNARKALWPLYKDFKRNPNNRASIVYPAKLVVNSNVVEDKFPGWSTYIKKNRLEQFELANEVGNRNENEQNVNRSAQINFQQRRGNLNTYAGIQTNSFNSVQQGNMRHTMNTMNTTNTTFTTTSRKQPWENVTPRDNSAMNENSSQPSQLSHSQSNFRPEKQTKQRTTVQKKTVAKKNATQRTSNPKPRKKTTVKTTPKMKPIANSRTSSTTRRRSQVSDQQGQPIREGSSTMAQSADSQSMNENHGQISRGATEDTQT